MSIEDFEVAGQMIFEISDIYQMKQLVHRRRNNRVDSPVKTRALKGRFQPLHILHSYCYGTLVVAMLLSGCGGKLSDEQRKKMKEGMEQQKIVKLSDADITTAAMNRGREVFEQLEQVHFDSSKVDSVAAAYQVRIKWLVPGKVTGASLEQQLIDAYITGMATGSLQENIQKIHAPGDPETYDSLVYSKPVVSPMPDGVENLEGIWNIYLSRKQIVLEASRE